MTKDAKKGSRPTHTAYAVRDYEKPDGKKGSQFTEIGSAWPHRDGKGFDVKLEATPAAGCRLILRVSEPTPVKAG